MANWTKEKATEIIRALLRQANAERNPNSGEPNNGAASIIENQAAKIASKYFSNPRIDNETDEQYEARIDREGREFLGTIDIAFISDTVKVLNELGTTTIQNIFQRVNARTQVRKIWYEELAKVVGEGYGCRVSANLDDGSVTFYGFDLDREIATFMFVKFAEVANEICLREMKVAKDNVGKPPSFNFKTKKTFVHPKVWMENDVWIDNFHLGFRQEIEKFLSNREHDVKKVQEVEEYFNQNKDSNIYAYWYSYRNRNLKQSEFNQQAFDVGVICGYNVAHRAEKAPSALTVKKSVISNKDKVILLIDESSSMSWGGNKMQQAIEGSLEYSRTAFNKKFQVDVIGFSNSAKIVAQNQDEMTEKFEEQVRSLHASGGTDLTAALRLAQSRFLNRNVKRKIMVVTDGQPNDPTSALQVAGDCKRMGIEILAIGCGDDVNQEFIDKLTSPGCGLLVDDSRLQLTMGAMAAKL